MFPSRAAAAGRAAMQGSQNCFCSTTPSVHWRLMTSPEQKALSENSKPKWITIPHWGPWHEAAFKLATGPSAHSVPVPEAICCLTRPGWCWGGANGGSTRASWAQAQWLTVRLIALLSISLSCSRGEWTLLCVEIKHGQLLENKSLFL